MKAISELRKAAKKHDLKIKISKCPFSEKKDLDLNSGGNVYSAEVMNKIEAVRNELPYDWIARIIAEEPDLRSQRLEILRKK